MSSGVRNAHVNPCYQKWKNMLNRCSENYWRRFPYYTGCSICKEWEEFDIFSSWVDTQPNKEWRSCELDKDILCDGNKVYSPSTCVFVTKVVNNFLNSHESLRGALMIGVHWDSSRGKFIAQCSDPFKENSRFLGRFDTEIEAHTIWKKTKHEYACKLAGIQKDLRVAEILKSKFIN
jgi:hypothetical protein